METFRFTFGLDDLIDLVFVGASDDFFARTALFGAGGAVLSSLLDWGF